MSIISKRGIFIIRNSLFNSAAEAAASDRHIFNFNNGGLFMSTRASFSSVHLPQGGNWVDDIRKGADNKNNYDDEGEDEDGISGHRRRGTKEGMRMREGMEDGDTRETTDIVGDIAKQGTRKAMETGIEFGEKAKQTMDIAWDGFKETSKKVKEAVVKGDDDGDDIKMRDYEGSTVLDEEDSHVHNLRKRSGGYDLRDKH